MDSSNGTNSGSEGEQRSWGSFKVVQIKMWLACLLIVRGGRYTLVHLARQIRLHYHGASGYSRALSTCPGSDNHLQRG